MVEAKVFEASVIEEDNEPLVPRRRKKNKPVALLVGLVSLIVLVLGVSIYFLVQIGAQSEAQLAKKADDELKAGQYPAAAKAFEQLATEYPASSDAPKYRFGTGLASMRVAAQSVANREDPLPALQKFQAFVATHRDSPFAKPLTGYGTDVFDAGSKLADDLADHAQDHVKKYQDDRGRVEELARAEAAAGEGRKLLPTLDAFRDPGVPASDSIRNKFDQLDQSLRGERERAQFVAGLRGLLADPSDEKIARAAADVKERGLDSAPDVQQVVDGARAALRKMIRFVADAAAPLPTPPVVGTSLLFATPVGKPAASFARPGESSGVFLASARGILYALDERTGALLWAARTGSDHNAPPARYTPDDGSPEIALLTTDLANAPALTARLVRTGEPLWYQPLPALAAGPAVVVGRRAYVATRDARGTIGEFDLVSGARLGSIAVGQPIGPGLIRRAGTGLLYVAADARRVFVLDVDARNDDGGRLEPRCTQVIATDHSPGTLRTAPLVIGPDGVGPETHWLVLTLANGPRSTKLRAFPLTEPPPMTGADANPPEAAVAAAAEWLLPGWPWFAPSCDGERLAVVTDAGEFRLFGVNQPGNQDAALFPIAAPPPPEKPRETEPLPGVVVAGGDDAFWVLASGAFGKVRLTFDPARGQLLIPTGHALALGVPTQPASLNGTRDTAFLVVRSARSAGFRAVAVDLTEGRLLWSRQLGLLPATAPVLVEGRVLLADEDGGLTLIPTEAFETRQAGDRVADPAWGIAPPFADATGPTAIASSENGAWAVTPHGPDNAPTFTLRSIAGGKVASATKVVAPARMAGVPLPVREGLVIPLADGFLYRFDAAAGRLTAGPAWREPRAGPDAVCFLAALPGEEFLATDGNREAKRWNWPADGSDWKRGPGTVTARERIARPPLVLPAATKGERPAVLIADQSGSAWLFDLARGEVIRRWRSGGANPVPIGPPTAGFGGNGKPTTAYVVDGRTLVVLNPESEGQPKTAAVPEGPPGVAFVGEPQRTPDGNWLMVDLGGRCTLFDGATARPILSRECGVAGSLPGTSGLLVDGRLVFVPLADGSAATVTLTDAKPGRAHETAPPPRPIEQ